MAGRQTPPAEAPAPRPLTPRQLEILCHAANRGGTRAAAAHLHLTEDAVRAILRRAYHRLGHATLTRTALTALATGQLRLFRDGTVAPAATPPAPRTTPADRPEPTAPTPPDQTRSTPCASV